MMEVEDWEYFKHLQHYAVLYGNVFVQLHGGPIDQPSKAEMDQLSKGVLLPLLAACNSAFLYGKYDDQDVLDITGTSYPRKRGKLELTGTDNPAVAHLLTDAGAPSDSGSLLLELPLSEDLLAPVLRSYCDPTVMAGLGSCCTKSAVAYAKRHFSEEKVHILFGHGNTGLNWMFLLTAKESYSTLTTIAAKHCVASESYRTLYGPGTKLAPLEHKASYGTGFNE